MFGAAAAIRTVHMISLELGFLDDGRSSFAAELVDIVLRGFLDELKSYRDVRKYSVCVHWGIQTTQRT